MPLDLDEKYKVHKVANKIVNMIESSGGEIFQPHGSYIDSDSDETECLNLWDWDSISLVYPESEIIIHIEIFYACFCDEDFDCDCNSTIEVSVCDFSTNDALIEGRIPDLSTYDYSDIINKIIDLMNSKK